MSKARLVQCNFRGGEISSFLEGRIDLTDRYYSSTLACRNFIVHSSGGISRRSGTYYITNSAYPSGTEAKLSRLVPFIFSVDQAYVLEFTHNKIRVFANGGIVGTDGTASFLDECDSSTDWSVYTDQGQSAAGTDTVDYKEPTACVTGSITSQRTSFIELRVTWPSVKTVQDRIRFWVKLTAFPDTDKIPKFTLRLTNSADQNVDFGFADVTADTWKQVTIDTSGVPSTFRQDVKKLSIIATYAEAVEPWTTTLKVDDIKTYAFTPVQISTPYSDSEVWELTFAQSADQMIIASRWDPPKVLSRKSHTEWSLDNFSFTYPACCPAEYWPSTSLTISGSDPESLTCTAGASTYLAADKGREIHVKKSGVWYHGVIKTYTSATVVTATFPTTDPVGSYASGDWYICGSPNTKIKCSDKQGVVTVTSKDAAFRSSDVGKYIRAFNGRMKITAYASATSVRARVIGEDLEDVFKPDDNDTPRWNWIWEMEEQAWTASKGYPGVVTLHEQRLWFAGSPTYPQTIWGSVPGDWTDFSKGSYDDAGIELTLASDIQEIRWMISARALMIATSSGIWRIGGVNSSEPITPTSLEVKYENNYPSACVQPVRFGTTLLFVLGTPQDLFGRAIMEMAYDFTEDSLVARQISALAWHLFSYRSILQTAKTMSPDPIAWFVVNDGTLVGLTYDYKEDLIAFHRHETTGYFESVASIPSTDGDVLYFVVRRNINETDVRMIEYMPVGPPPAMGYCDSAIYWSGNPSVSFAGLGHLAGQTVTVQADAAAHPDVTVSEYGTITLQYPVEELIAGLSFNSYIQTLPPEVPGGGGSLQARLKRIARMAVKIYQSQGLRVGMTVEGLKPVPLRRTTDYMDTPVPFITGDVVLSPEVGWEEGRLIIASDGPLALSISTLVMDVRVGENV